MNSTVSALVASLLLLMPSMAKSQEQSSDDLLPVGTIYLLLRFGQVDGASLTTIPMPDMIQCEMEGAKFTSSDRLYPAGDYRGFECIEGK